MFALLLYGAEAFAIQRKVTLTARTVTDLITQTTPTMVSGQPSVPQSSIDSDLAYASSVLAPYAASNLTMLATEVLINSDQTTATVQWSEPYNGATVRAAGSTVTLPTGLGTGQAGNYFVMGEVYYNLHAAQPVYPDHGDDAARRDLSDAARFARVSTCWSASSRKRVA